MSNWIQCPNCGTVMTVTTSGYLCPMCGTALPVKILHMTSGTSAECVPVRHGKWIFNPKDAIEMMFTLPKCSECGAESVDGENYCPNCGARMDGE